MAEYYYYTQHSFVDYLRDPNYMPPPKFRPAPNITAAPAAPAAPAPPQSAPPPPSDAVSKPGESEAGELLKRKYENSSEESEETAGEELMGPWLTPKRVCVRKESSEKIGDEGEEEEEEESDEEEEEEEEEEEDEEEDEEDEDEEDEDEDEATGPALADMSPENLSSGLQYQRLSSQQSRESGCLMDSLFESEIVLFAQGGHPHNECQGKQGQQDIKLHYYSVDSLFESGPSLMTYNGHQHCESNGWRSKGHDSSKSKSEPKKEADSLPSVQQHQPSYQFEYSQKHSCCTDSVLESDTSHWDTSRDHSLEAEIVFAYDLADVPRTAAEMLKLPMSSYRRDVHSPQLPEIDENDFARWFNDNREERQKERNHWNAQLQQETRVNLERRKVHVAYMNKCEARRKAKAEKKSKRTPIHEEKRLQKKKLRVSREVERMRKSIEEKGKEAWEKEHCDPEMKEAVKKEVKKLYGGSMLA
jgi:hypothetical protein